MTWSLEGEEIAYEHFKPPFILATAEVFRRIRNVQIRIRRSGELLPVELPKYDEWLIYEALHNCIAHQNYAKRARVVVRELPDRLIFENTGPFIEGSPDDYVEGKKRPQRYRNSVLAGAMVELQMIDSMGYGIHRMHRTQIDRSLPLPSYEMKDQDTVVLTVYGTMVDQKYTDLLLEHTELTFADVLAVDRVQKGQPISDEAVARLRRKKLIEGRRPTLRIAADVAAASESRADYIRTRAQDDEFYAKQVCTYLEKFGQASRDDLNKLLWKQLSDALDDAQKYRKIGNLLTKLRRRGQVRNTGSRGQPRWVLLDRVDEAGG